MTGEIDATTFVPIMQATTGSPRQQTNGQTARDLAELHKAWIHEEAPVAAMVEVAMGLGSDYMDHGFAPSQAPKPGSHHFVETEDAA